MKIMTVTMNPAIDREITISDFSYGGLNRVLSSTDFAGGKGINSASALFYDGMDVTALIMPGMDNLTEFSGLLGEKAGFCELAPVPGKTRINMKILDSAKITTEINGTGPEVSGLSEFMSRLDALSYDLLILSGSVPANVPKTVYRDLILKAKDRKIKTILDADGELLKYGLKATPYAVKPNLYELSILSGRELSSPEEIKSEMEKIASTGVKLVVVSAGAEGAYFLMEGQFLFAPSKPVNVCCTVGAGDAMVASLAKSILLNRSLPELADRAVSAGSFAASMPGVEYKGIEL